MKNFYVLIYSTPDGGHFGEQVKAKNSTSAIKAAVKTHFGSPWKKSDRGYLEVIAVIEGEPRFDAVDEKKFNLFPGC